MAGSSKETQAMLAERVRQAVDFFESNGEGARVNNMDQQPDQSGGVKRARVTSEANTSLPTFSMQPAKSQRQDRNAVIRNLWVRLSKAGEYEQLRTALSNNFQLSTKENMNNFFIKEGPYLLMWAILYSEKPDSLRFICDYVPEDILREGLRRKNYTALEAFLLGETGLEKQGPIDVAKLEHRLEKFALLLKVDPGGIEEYTRSNYFQTRFSRGVQESFGRAIAECRTTRPPTARY